MTYRDHTRSWRRLCAAMLCRLCGSVPGSCDCRRRSVRDRFSALWRKLRRKDRRASAVQRKIARLHSEIAMLQARVTMAEQRARRAENALAVERYSKQALFDTMTPGIRRGQS